MCVGHGSGQQAEESRLGILGCRGCAPSLQGDQALACGDGEQEVVLRDEERRDDMIPGCFEAEGRGAVQGRVGRATF